MSDRDDADDPFRVTSSRDVYDNPWIHVREHLFTTPSGKEGLYGVVHFKHRAVGAIPYEDGRIWLVGQRRFTLGAYSWEIPAGGAPEGEDLVETARRELREETGLEAGSIERIVTMHMSNSVTDELGVVFVARGLTRGVASPEDTELLRVVEAPLDEAYARVERGEITDSLSVAGIVKLVLMKREGRLD
ncbi:MAG TPA: NUDIX hydrolase [Byssovorax sp.]